MERQEQDWLLHSVLLTFFVSGMAVVVVATALLLLSIILSVTSVKLLQNQKKDENAKRV